MDGNIDDTDDGWASDVGFDSNEEEEYMNGDAHLGIPLESEARVTTDLEELNLLPRFKGLPDLKESTRVKVRIGIMLSNFGMGQEQRLAWGLGSNNYVVISAEFGPHYLHEAVRPKIDVGVSQTFEIDSTISRFMLSWTLEDRIKNKFLNLWPFESETFEPPVDFSHIKSIMEMFPDVGYLLARAAFEKTGKMSDPNAAILLLTDEKQTFELKRTLGRSLRRNTEGPLAPPPTKKRRIDLTLNDSDDEMKSHDGADQRDGYSTEILDLAAEMNVPPNVAALAVTLEGFEGAQQILADPAMKQHLIDSTETPISSSSSSSSSGGGSSASSNSRKEKGKPLERILSRHNVLVRLAQFAADVLANANKNCMICGHVLDYSGFKPAVCNTPSCLYGYQEFGLGFDLTLEAIDRPILLDLLITLTMSAILQDRIKLCFPEAVRAGKSNEHSFMVGSKDETQDRDKLQQILELCPAVSTLTEWAKDGMLIRRLNQIHPLLNPLLRWIVTSNRAHIRQLRDDERIKGINTDYQFVFVSCSPEREAEFASLVEYAAQFRGPEKGVLQTWHGSPVGNWHGILRLGLKNYSGTKNQLHGAAHGRGVYMAKDLKTSIAYCRPVARVGWAKSIFGSDINCMALCELVNHPHLKPPKPFYVVSQEEWIVTRFFFLFTHTQKMTGLLAEKVKVPKIR